MLNVAEYFIQNIFICKVCILVVMNACLLRGKAVVFRNSLDGLWLCRSTLAKEILLLALLHANTTSFSSCVWLLCTACVLGAWSRLQVLPAVSLLDSLYELNLLTSQVSFGVIAEMVMKECLDVSLSRGNQSPAVIGY